MKIVCLTILIAALLAAPSPAAEGPALPPGVRLEPLPAAGRLSLKLHAEMIAVDWTHPLLRARLSSGVAPGGAAPLDWADAERARPEALRIQLAEPVERTRGKWELALPLAAPGAPLPGHPFFAISSLCPWAPGGGPLAEEPEYASPLAPASARVAVRWLGRQEDLASITTMTFHQRVLVSWMRPDTGRGRFALVVHQSDGEFQVSDLQAWLAAATDPADWLAFHGEGRYATVGTAGWRLAAEAKARRAERLGGVLELRGLKRGEAADWARLPGAMAAASTFELDAEPANLIKGLLWPAPFAPRVWISKPIEPDALSPEWVEVDLGTFRPVDRIVLAWPAVAGWSEQFQPGRVTVAASLEQRAGLKPIAELKSPEGLTWEYRFSQTTPLRKVRIEFTQPSSMALDRRARLAAVQLWGPWDGATGTR